MSSSKNVIVYAKRTAIGKMGGMFSSTPAPKMSSFLIKDFLASSGVPGSEIDEVILGNVLTAGVGQAPARQAAIYGGLPETTQALTINKVCGSGLKAVMLADDTLKLGRAQMILAGGQENMTLAPHMLPNSRSGYKFGSVELKDHMQWDGLWDPYNNVAMGNCGEICAKEFKFSRESQDEFAMSSYTKSRQAWEKGWFKDEVLPITISTRKGDIVLDKDEEPFSVDLAKLPKLRPAFDKEGTVTAGNASSINDGSCILAVCSEDYAKQKNLKPLAKIIDHCSFAGKPEWFTTAPISAMQKLLSQTNMSIGDIDLFEINEAFAVVTMVAQQELSIPAEKVNPFGGAVSLGHPIGASGARILTTLINGLQQMNKKRGMASICIGGGEASAMLIETMS